MKRAVVYVAWGEPYIREAEISAATAALVGADRLLVTDAESARHLSAGAPFEQVITREFRLPGMYRKVEMLDVLPAAYESFLYLDTDTHILLEIGQGFERAERHGIAVAPAAHYSLEHFWDFSEILDRREFVSRGILQYNAGVIFFTRRPDAWEVMRSWYDFCEASEGDPTGHFDQPYLTLAMETAGFNPYTLSIAYNYRNFGELVSGDIRIWHSHVPPPPDVNVYDQPWPPRRFVDSVRMPAGADKNFGRRIAALLRSLKCLAR